MPEYTFFAERTQEKAWICRISCHRRNDMTAEEIKKKDSEYIMHTYGRFDIVLDHGKGATLWDADGKSTWI